MKNLSLALLLSLSAITAQAQTSDAPAAQPQVAAEETMVISSDGTAAQPKAVADSKSHCVRDTGSRTKRRDDKGCNGLPGRSYDRDALDSTGAIDTADALRRLDPSIGR